MKKAKFIGLLALCSMFTTTLAGCNGTTSQTTTQDSSTTGDSSTTQDSSTTDDSSTTTVAHVHSFTRVAATKSNCHEDGMKEHYECECGEWSSDGTESGIKEHSYFANGGFYAITESLGLDRENNLYAIMHLVYGTISASSTSPLNVVAHSMKSYVSDTTTIDHNVSITYLTAPNLYDELSTVSAETGSFAAYIGGIGSIYDLTSSNGVIFTPRDIDTDLCELDKTNRNLCKYCNSYHALSISSLNSKTSYSLKSGDDQLVYIVTPELTQNTEYHVTNETNSYITVRGVNYSKLGSSTVKSAFSTGITNEYSFTPTASGQYVLSITVDARVNISDALDVEIFTYKTSVNFVSSAADGLSVPEGASDNRYYVTSTDWRDVTDQTQDTLAEMYIKHGDTSYTIWSEDADSASWLVPYLYNKYDYGVTNVTVILQASVNSSWVDAFKYKFDEMYTGYNVETTGEESVTLNSIVAANTNTLFDNGGKWIYSGSTIDLRVKTIIEPYA